MSLSLNFNKEFTFTTCGGGGLSRPCISSIDGRFLTSSALIPFSFIDFFASCISSGLRNRIPLFFGVGFGVGSGRVQSLSLLNILFNSFSACSTVRSLKTQPAQLSRWSQEALVSPL